MRGRRSRAQRGTTGQRCMVSSVPNLEMCLVEVSVMSVLGLIMRVLLAQGVDDDNAR
jgi:hypothetical protein